MAMGDALILSFMHFTVALVFVCAKLTLSGQFFSVYETHVTVRKRKVRRKRGRGRDWVAKTARNKGMEQHPNPIKKDVSHKQPSLISSTSKIQKCKKNVTHKQVRSADLLL